MHMDVSDKGNNLKLCHAILTYLKWDSPHNIIWLIILDA